MARLLLLRLLLLERAVSWLLGLYHWGLGSARARLLLVLVLVLVLLALAASWLLGLCHSDRCPGRSIGLVSWRLKLGLHA